MKIWRLTTDCDNFASFIEVPRLSVEELQSFDGRSLIAQWQKRELEPLDDVELPIGDVLGLGAYFLVNNTVRTLFDDFGITDIEYLPMVYQNTTYYLPNALGTVDCLDRKKSKALYSPTTKDRILFVNRYSFHEYAIGEKLLFRLKDEPLRLAFVTDKLVSAIRSSGIKGFCFELIYDGNDDPSRKVSFDGVISAEY